MVDMYVAGHIFVRRSFAVRPSLCQRYEADYILRVCRLPPLCGIAHNRSVSVLYSYTFTILYTHRVVQNYVGSMTSLL